MTTGDRNILVLKTLSIPKRPLTFSLSPRGRGAGVRGGLHWRDRDLPRTLMSACRAMFGVRMVPSPAGARGWLVAIVLLLLLLNACATTGKGTIAELRNTRIEIKEEGTEDAREKAIESYRHFLEKTPDSASKPDAIRRLADLKLEKGYGVLSDNAPEKRPDQRAAPAKAGDGEAPGDRPVQGVDDPESAGLREAIELYKKLLNDYPSYERNELVMYQLSRAYE